jgi:AraC family ethanolamine operon transcriptional activator
MHSTVAPLFPRRVSYQFSDPVEFSAALPGGRFECLALRGEVFDTKVEILHLPGMTLRTTDTSAHTSRAALEPGSTTLFMQAQSGDAGLRFNGMPMPLAAVGVAVGGGDLTMVAERRVSGIILQLPFSLTDGVCDGWSVRFIEQAGVQLLDAPIPASRRLAKELRAAAGILDDSSDILLAHEHAERLGLSLRELIVTALADAAGPRAPQRAVREAVRVLRQVEDLLFSRLSEPIYTTQVCNALKVSPRKLHDAIVATCGMSPHAYLKARRLSLARRALRTAAPEARLVKRVAIAHGFWHFGNFAHDYRELFRETPSETSSRAIGAHAACA